MSPAVRSRTTQEVFGPVGDKAPGGSPHNVAIKLKLPWPKARKKARRKPGAHLTLADYASMPAVRISVAAFIIVCAAFLGVFAYYYIRYQKIIDARMKGQIFETSARLYAAPRVLEVGDKISPSEIASQLRRAGYAEDGHSESKLGSYRLLDRGVEIKPGPESYHTPDGAVVHISSGKVDRIVGLGSTEGKTLDAYELEPQLVTALFDNQQRSKRQLVSYDQLPKVLVDAVLAIEDRRFFQHSGVNYFRSLEVLFIDLREGRRNQGASTLTMQIARGFFLTPEKTIKRKLTEMMIALELEQRFSKKQIFELYANQIPMGQRGSFGINGLGEAARAYFNKDIKDVNLTEAALLAAIIQRPSYLSPYRHPERALERRNLVLDSMVETGAITRQQAETAKATPLKLAPLNVEASDAPYFVDLVREGLQQRYTEHDLNLQQNRIYTTLDADLQRAAAEAVELGLKSVDAQLLKQRTRKVKVGTGKTAKMETKILPGQDAQVALVAMDPHTGEVLALVGGRSYGVSQLNHALAKRPTGSIFKPFVYAAAVNTAVAGTQPVFTSASTVDDSPTTFTYGDEIYEPRNYKEEYHGPVTARYALAMSLNNATVRLAEEVGYDRVADLARAAGITSVKATPAIALGAYEATPLDMAGAYTIFANGGTRISPMLVKSVRNAHGDVVEDFEAQKKPVLDPRVAYVLTSMMETVVNSGLGYEVRRNGFTAPAAGKTGSSHDAWFAGYTNNLLCIVWVGLDDYTDLKISGALAAAPIWAAFMKRAQQLPQYHDMKSFVAPQGVINVTLDKNTNRIATPSCPDTYTAAFIAGTEPHDTCEQTPGQQGVFTRLGNFFGLGAKAQPPPSTNAGSVTPGIPVTGPQSVQTPVEEPQKKKKGFFGKIFGVFKDDKEDQKDKGKDKDKDKNNGAAKDAEPQPPPPPQGNTAPHQQP
jgi:penicillin-binding protein 1B